MVQRAPHIAFDVLQSSESGEGAANVNVLGEAVVRISNNADAEWVLAREAESNQSEAA